MNLLKSVHPLDLLLFFLMFLWVWYLATGYRSPLTPITISDENQGSSIRQLLFLSTGAVGFLRLFLYRNMGYLFRQFLPYTCLTLLIGLSVFWSYVPTISAKRSILFALGYLALVATIAFRKKPVYTICIFLVTVTSLLALCSLALYLLFPSIYSVNPARPGLAGLSNHPNTIAPFLSIGFLLTFSLGAQTFTGKILLWGCKVCLLLALLLTMSMTTIITTCLACGFIFWLTSDSYRKGILQITATVSLCLIYLIGLGNIKSTFFATTGRDESLSGRDELWTKVWEEAKKEPFIGVGYGGFWTEGKGRDLVQTWNPRQSHNALLDVFVDLGLLGVVICLIIFPTMISLYSFYYLKKVPLEHRKVVSVLFAIFLSYFFFYGQAQSFLLKMDSFPFVVISWSSLLLIGGKDSLFYHEAFLKNENCTLS